MSTIDPAVLIPELTEDHADGTWYVDVEGDLWQAFPLGWVTTRRTPFSIYSQVAHPGPRYGPYRAVMGPPDPTHHGDTSRDG